MNASLENLYNSKWVKLCSAMQPILADENLEIKPCNPLLLKVNDVAAFNNADIRLMIYGQETNGWDEEFNSNISSTLGTYDEFFNTEDCFRYGGQFWNGVNRFLSLLRTKYPDKKSVFYGITLLKLVSAPTKVFLLTIFTKLNVNFFPL